MPTLLQKERPNWSTQQCDAAVKRIQKQIRETTNTLFCAFENEYTVFAPLSNCFEWYGLDFLVSENLNVTFLEANPGTSFVVLTNIYVLLYHKTIMNHEYD